MTQDPMREALKPFAEFAKTATNESGWASNIHREPISAWFGPSDFRAVIAALAATQPAPLGREAILQVLRSNIFLDWLNASDGHPAIVGFSDAADAILASTPAPSAASLERAYAAARENLGEAWSAMAMIRETIETLAPSGGVKASEHLDGPTFMHESDALVEGIRMLAEAPNVDREEVIEECAKVAERRTNMAGSEHDWNRGYSIGRLNAATEIRALAATEGKT